MKKQDILIVGASAGIGRACFETLRSEASLKTISRSEFSESSEHYILDVTQDALPEINDPLDHLIYCPGSMRLKPFTQLKTNDFADDLELNLLGAIKVIQTYLPNLKNADAASITLFSTVAVSQGMPFHSSIAASKGAVEGLVRSLAAELAPRIRVNAIAPSLTRTKLSTRLLRNTELEEKAGNRHPLKRVGEPEDIAGVVNLLIQPNSWITGQVLHVDGGISSLNI